MDPTAAAAWVNVLQGPLFLCWGFATGELNVGDGYWPYGLGALLLQTLANLLLFHALSISPLSATIPFLSLTPVFTSLAAIVWLRQYPSALQWLGIAVVVGGTLLVHAGGEQSLWQRLRSERGSLMTIAVAALLSLLATLDRLALEHASLPVHGAVQSGGVGVAIMLTLAVRGRAPSLRVRPDAVPLIAACVVAAGAALGLQLYAIQLLFVGLVETIKRAIGVAAAVLLGRMLFAEPVTPHKLASVALIVAGTVLLVFA
ncbi:MAG: EamA family transporter, partial [Myxococcota bacterium]